MGLLLGEADGGSPRRKKGMQDSGSHLASGQPAFAGGRGVMGLGHFYREQTFPWKRMEVLEGGMH